MSRIQLRKLGLAVILVILRGLILLKRALTFLFFTLGGWLGRGGPFLNRHFLFPLYKLYLFLRKRLAFLIDPLARRLAAFSLGRVLLTTICFILVLIFVLTETKVYASSKYLGGQESLISQYVGVDDDIDITEDVVEPGLVSAPTPWTSGLIFQPSPFNQTEVKLEEIAGTALDGLALVQPLFLPGAVFGSGRAKTIYHVVEAGDTFGSLAQKFDVSIETILWANDLSSRGLLHPGDILKILPVSGVAHKVKKGDTVKKVAELYSTSEEKILEFNRLAAADLVEGEEIIVPDGRIRGVAPVPGSLYNVPPRRAVVTLPPSVERFLGGFIWPTALRRITQYFRWRHPGIDIGLPTGNPIYAAADGVVEIAGWNRGGYGYMILIDHGNGFKTRYGHASRLYVTAGESVSKGQVIGLIGSTGHSTGPHLHFEVLARGARVNPLLYVR